MNSLTSISPELAEIIGLLCAEGCHVVQYPSYWGKDRGKPRYYINHKSERIECCSKDKKLLNHFKILLQKEFEYFPNITKDNKINICKRNIIRSIIYHTSLGCSCWKVPEVIIKSSKKIKIRFLRGFFDGDGTCSKYIRMFSINHNGLIQVSKLLNDLTISHYFEKPLVKNINLYLPL